MNLFKQIPRHSWPSAAATLSTYTNTARYNIHTLKFKFFENFHSEYVINMRRNDSWFGSDPAFTNMKKRVYELFLSSHHKEIQLQNLKILYRIRSKQDRKPHVLTYISWYKNGLFYKMQINAYSLAKCTELNCFWKTSFVPQKILNSPVKAEDKFKYLLSPVFYQMFWNLLLILCRTYFWLL